MVGRRRQVAADVPGPLVEHQVDLGDDPAVGVGTRHDPGARRVLSTQLYGRCVCPVTTRVDLGIERAVDLDDRARQIRSNASTSPGAGIAALVQQDDDRVTPFACRTGTSALAVSASSRKSYPWMPAAATSVSVASRVMPMNPTLMPSTFVIQYGGSGVLPVVVLHVGGEPLEVGAGVRLVREVAAVDRMTAAVLHAEQLGDTFVELVVADARHVEAPSH